MKGLLGYFCVGFLTVAHAEVPVAHVYDLSAPSVHRPVASISDSVSAETARLIVAQRLGLAQYHSLKGVDEQTIRQLNDFGGPPQRLLSKGYGDSSPGKLLVIVEGIQNPDSKQLSARKLATKRSMECTRARKLMLAVSRHLSTPRRHISGLPNLRPTSFVRQRSATRKPTFTRKSPARDHQRLYV